VTCAELASAQQPGSSDVEQLSEKAQREAAPIIDAFDLTVVCCTASTSSFLLLSSCQLSFEFTAYILCGVQDGPKNGLFLEVCNSCIC